MGKYIKKANNKGEAAAMEATSTLGVRTRAKTLALQSLQRPLADSYLQLRSRRLEKPPAPKPNPNPNPSPNPNSDPKSRGSPGIWGAGQVNSGSVVGSVSLRSSVSPSEASPDNEVFFEARSRNARETTPCSLIKDPEAVGTPGSTTRPTRSTADDRRAYRLTHGNIPSSQDMEEFFSVAEQLQQKEFAEKYNFDPANDVPLPGRYEWVRVDNGKPLTE